MYRNIKTMLSTGVAALFLGLVLPAHAAFVGAYDVSLGTLSAPDGGSADLSGAPGSLLLTGSNTGIDPGHTATTAFSFSAPVAALIGFNFFYSTNDVSFGLTTPARDPAGYLLNGVFTQLSIDEFNIVPFGAPVPNPQSGSAAFAVAAGDIFGFYVDSLDSSFGEASLHISNFNANVPEPASLALLGMGLAGIVASRQRKRA